MMPREPEPSDFEIADIAFGKNTSIDRSFVELSGLHPYYMEWKNKEIASHKRELKITTKEVNVYKKTYEK